MSKKTFKEPSLELKYRQMRQIKKKPFGIKVVVFKNINTRKKDTEWSFWLLKCPKGIEFEVQ